MRVVSFVKPTNLILSYLGLGVSVKRGPQAVQAAGIADCEL